MIANGSLLESMDFFISQILLIYPHIIIIYGNLILDTNYYKIEEVPYLQERHERLSQNI